MVIPPVKMATSSRRSGVYQTRKGENGEFFSAHMIAAVAGDAYRMLSILTEQL